MGAQATFVGEDMSQIIKESIDSVLQNQQYVLVKVPNWTSATVENCMKRLAALSKPFKVSAPPPPSPPPSLPPPSLPTLPCVRQRRRAHFESLIGKIPPSPPPP